MKDRATLYGFSAEVFVLLVAAVEVAIVSHKIQSDETPCILIAALAFACTSLLIQFVYVLNKYCKGENALMESNADDLWEPRIKLLKAFLTLLAFVLVAADQFSDKK
uniref:Uncharacterized protein n=1 Tax=Pinguiococcus pyrenoidosus TaxID=172671 RepID=A0A7R9UFV5_9STRA